MTAQTTGPAAPQEARPRDQRKLLTDLDPSVVLSVLTGVVAVFGLLNQVIFYRFFDISYVAYIGTGDFLALVLQTIPFTLLVVLVLLAASALTVIGLIYSGAGLLSWFWKLVVALSKLCRLALVRLCGLFAATAAWLLRQDGQGAMARASGQRDLVAAIAQAAQKLSRLCLSYEPVCAQRSASGREKQEKVAQAKRASLQWWLAFANRRYFELFLGFTVVTLLIGIAFSAFAGWRLELRIQEREDERSRWETVDTTLSFFFPGFLAEKTVSVASLQPAIENAVFLGATSAYGFFVRSTDAVAVVVPVDELELVTLAKAIAEEDPLHKGDELAERLTEIATAVTGVNEAVTVVSGAVQGVSESLDRAGSGRVAAGQLSPATLSADCRENPIKGIDFRFAYAGSDPLASAILAGPTKAVSVDEYRVPVAHYNAVQRARLVDYVITTPSGYLPGDYLLVEGHASGEGTFAYNERLAEARAQAVRDYLSVDEVWDHVQALNRSNVRDASLHWRSAEEIRASFTAVGRGEHAWQNDPLDPRNRRALVYHCRPQPLQLDDAQALSEAAASAG